MPMPPTIRPKMSRITAGRITAISTAAAPDRLREFLRSMAFSFGGGCLKELSRGYGHFGASAAPRRHWAVLREGWYSMRQYPRRQLTKVLSWPSKGTKQE